MQRAIDRFGEPVIGGHREEHVARLHRHLELVEIVILQQLDMIERAFDQRFGAGLAIFLEQVLLEAPGVDPDADRAAIGLGGADHFGDPLRGADIARIDPEAGRALVGGFQRALVMEMDVRNDRHLGSARDLVEMPGRFFGGAGDADDIGTHFLAAADLVDRRSHILGRGVGHGLDADRRIAADRDLADHDLAALAALDIAPGA